MSGGSIRQRSSAKVKGLFGKSKVEYATSDDLLVVRNVLLAEISHLRNHAHHEAEFLDTNIREVLKVVDQNHKAERAIRQAALLDTCAFAKQSCENVRNELRTELQKLEDRIFTGFDNKYNQLLESRSKEMNGLKSYVDAEFQHIRANHNAYDVSTELKLTNLLAHMEATSKTAIEELRNTLLSCQNLQSSLEHRVGSMESLQSDKDHLQDAIMAEANAKNQLRLEQLSSALGNLASKCDELTAATRDEATAKVAGIEETHGVRIASLEATVARFDQAVAEAGSVPTRQVEWIVKDVSQLIADAAALPPAEAESTDVAPSSSSNTSVRSWRSPFFDAASVHNLQLELHTLQPTSHEDSYGCSLSLWAPADLQLVFKIGLGEISHQFTHIFKGEAPFSTKRLCGIAEQVCGEEDTLCVRIEILEALSTVEYQCRDMSQKAGEEESTGLNSCIRSHRHLNHSTLDLVQDEVNRMQSRMTRRVEWKVEQGSMLQRCFPQGESLCSSTFMAAGLDGLQLVFFPSGSKDAKEGYCSLYLHCPGDSVLKFLLSAGTQRREARISFEQKGFYGRTNFCRFENCLDSADDSVMLLLEIEEAQQTDRQYLSHGTMSKPSTASGYLSKPSTASGPNHQSSLTSLADTLPDSVVGEESLRNITSTMKLQRIPGRNGLEAVNRLPSIWTSEPPGNIEDVMQGYKQFSDMRPRKTDSSSGARQGLTTPRSGLNSAGTSKSDIHRFPFIKPQVSQSARAPVRTRKYAAYE